MSEGITQGNVKGAYLVTRSITPSEVATITAVEQTFTVPGAKVGDAVFVSPPGTQSGAIAASARVTAANTVGINFVNPTAGNVTPTAGNYLFTIIRPGAGAAKASVID